MLNVRALNQQFEWVNPARFWNDKLDTLVIGYWLWVIGHRMGYCWFEAVFGLWSWVLNRG